VLQFKTKFRCQRVNGADSPSCRRCGEEDENTAHILCECEALISHRYVYLGSSFLDPEDIKSLNLGVISNFSKEQGSLELVSDYGA
jgi:hypothetical protein